MPKKSWIWLSTRNQAVKKLTLSFPSSREMLFSLSPKPEKPNHQIFREYQYVLQNILFIMKSPSWKKSANWSFEANTAADSRINCPPEVWPPILHAGAHDKSSHRRLLVSVRQASTFQGTQNIRGFYKHKYFGMPPQPSAFPYFRFMVSKPSHKWGLFQPGNYSHPVSLLKYSHTSRL